VLSGTRTYERKDRGALTVQGGGIRWSLADQQQSRCPALVVSQQSAQRLATDDVVEAEHIQRLGRRELAQDGHVAKPLVWPELMVIGKPTREDVP